MNDYWNDPPDGPEYPHCCGEPMEINEQGCWCPSCGGFIKHQQEDSQAWANESQEPAWDDRMVNFPAQCPHGKEWFNCDACDRESDFQTDCYRERQHFGR